MIAEFDEFDNWAEPPAPDLSNATDADITILQGDGNSPPLQSDNEVQMYNSPLQILGSIGTTARDLGTALGTTVANVKAAQGNYKTAYSNASNGNKLGTWWQYASTTDKLMVGLAVVGIIIALKD